MPVFGVPRDPPPLGFSFEPIIVDDLDCMTGSFDAYIWILA